MKKAIVILSVVIVSLLAVLYYISTRKELPMQALQPVVLENLSKVDSLQKQCSIRDSQLLKTEALLTAKEKAYDGLEYRLNKSDMEVDTMNARYNRNHTLNQCDSLVSAQAYNIGKKDSAINDLKITVGIQKDQVSLLKVNLAEKDSSISLLQKSVLLMTTDINALNYYRAWVNDHPFKRWIVGIKKK